MVVLVVELEIFRLLFLVVQVEQDQFSRLRWRYDHDPA
jgi:hypothetical protein